MVCLYLLFISYVVMKIMVEKSLIILIIVYAALKKSLLAFFSIFFIGVIYKLLITSKNDFCVSSDAFQVGKSLMTSLLSEYMETAIIT